MMLCCGVKKENEFREIIIRKDEQEIRFKVKPTNAVNENCTDEDLRNLNKLLDDNSDVFLSNIGLDTNHTFRVSVSTIAILNNITVKIYKLKLNNIKIKIIDNPLRVCCFAELDNKFVVKIPSMKFELKEINFLQLLVIIGVKQSKDNYIISSNFDLSTLGINVTFDILDLMGILNGFKTSNETLKERIYEIKSITFYLHCNIVMQKKEIDSGVFNLNLFRCVERAIPCLPQNDWDFLLQYVECDNVDFNQYNEIEKREKYSLSYRDEKKAGVLFCDNKEIEYDLIKYIKIKYLNNNTNKVIRVFFLRDQIVFPFLYIDNQNFNKSNEQNSDIFYTIHDLMIIVSCILKEKDIINFLYLLFGKFKIRFIGNIEHRYTQGLSSFANLYQLIILGLLTNGIDISKEHSTYSQYVNEIEKYIPLSFSNILLEKVNEIKILLLGEEYLFLKEYLFSKEYFAEKCSLYLTNIESLLEMKYLISKKNNMTFFLLFAIDVFCFTKVKHHKFNEELLQNLIQEEAIPNQNNYMNPSSHFIVSKSRFNNQDSIASNRFNNQNSIVSNRFNNQNSIVSNRFNNQNSIVSNRFNNQNSIVSNRFNNQNSIVSRFNNNNFDRSIKSRNLYQEQPQISINSVNPNRLSVHPNERINDEYFDKLPEHISITSQHDVRRFTERAEIEDELLLSNENDQQKYITPFNLDLSNISSQHPDQSPNIPKTSCAENDQKTKYLLQNKQHQEERKEDVHFSNQKKIYYEIKANTNISNRPQSSILMDKYKNYSSQVESNAKYSNIQNEERPNFDNQYDRVRTNKVTNEYTSNIHQPTYKKDSLNVRQYQDRDKKIEIPDYSSNIRNMECNNNNRVTLRQTQPIVYSESTNTNLKFNHVNREIVGKTESNNMKDESPNTKNLKDDVNNKKRNVGYIKFTTNNEHNVIENNDSGFKKKGISLTESKINDSDLKSEILIAHEKYMTKDGGNCRKDEGNYIELNSLKRYNRKPIFTKASSSSVEKIRKEPFNNQKNKKYNEYNEKFHISCNEQSNNNASFFSCFDDETNRNEDKFESYVTKPMKSKDTTPIKKYINVEQIGEVFKIKYSGYEEVHCTQSGIQFSSEQKPPKEYFKTEKK